jgi:hypothetical protein
MIAVLITFALTSSINAMLYEGQEIHHSRLAGGGGGNKIIQSIQRHGTQIIDMRGVQDLDQRPATPSWWESLLRVVSGWCCGGRRCGSPEVPRLERQVSRYPGR